MFLSARDLEEDILNGYEIGADDYVTKPFSMKILLKKISIILSREVKKTNIYDDGFLKIDFELGVVQIEEKSCPITPTEYRILKKLIDNKGQLLTYSVLLDSLWEEELNLWISILLQSTLTVCERKLKQTNIVIFQTYTEWDIYGNNLHSYYCVVHRDYYKSIMEKSLSETRYL